MRKKHALTIAVIVAAMGTFAFAEVVIETVTVGNPGNADDTHGDGYGGVDYLYNIGKFEVTAGQYAEFLNAVGATDTYGLYNPDMNISPRSCQITQNGTSGSYTYDFSGRPSGTEADWVDRPVGDVSWIDAARFANWLHNGQPTGPQDLTTTEDGSYFINGALIDADVLAVVRKPGATWVLPTEDEWYKAAYHYNDGVTGNYFDYPTSSDTLPGYVNNSVNLSGTVTPFTEGGVDPGNYATFNGDEGAEGIGSPYKRTKVGEWENSESPYGTFDQGGNVAEWTEAISFDAFGTFRGGDSNNSFHFLRALNLIAVPRGTEFPTLGIRVAIPAPAVCGDGLIAGEEECDDENIANGDGCDSTCQVEQASSCSGEPSICVTGIPAVSEWGMAVMSLLMLTLGTLVITRLRSQPIS